MPINNDNLELWVFESLLNPTALAVKLLADSSDSKHIQTTTHLTVLVRSNLIRVEALADEMEIQDFLHLLFVAANGEIRRKSCYNVRISTAQLFLLNVNKLINTNATRFRWISANRIRNFQFSSRSSDGKLSRVVRKLFEACYVEGAEGECRGSANL